MLRINQNEKAEIRALNRRANTKFNRLFKTYGLTKKRLRKDFFKYGIAENFNVTKISDFKTRKELNEYKQNINRFLSRGVFSFVKGGLNIVTIKGEKEYFHYPIPRDVAWMIRRELAKSNKDALKRMREASKTPYEIMGKVQKGISSATIIKTLYQPKTGLKFPYATFKAVKFNPKSISNKQQLNRFIYGVKKYRSKRSVEERDNQMRLNYIDALQNTFGSGVKSIIDIIEDMSPSEFRLFYLSEDFASFDYIYDPNQALEFTSYIANHLMHFITSRNLTVENKKLENLRWITDSDSTIFFASEYNKGSKEGKRYILMKEGKRYYIDLTDEEYEDILYGVKQITELEDYEKRIKRQKIASMPSID